MSNRDSFTVLTPPRDEPVTFEVRSAEEVAAPLRLLADWTAESEPAVVVIARSAEGGSLEELIEAMMPTAAVPSSLEALQARRNAEARWRLLAELGALTAREVADLAGSEAQNRSALAGHWLREGEVLAVTHRGTRYFPAFQFGEEGRPLPAMRKILPHLADLGDWQRALWFATRTRLLGDRRPVDLLGSDPEAVLAAAEEEARPLE